WDAVQAMRCHPYRRLETWEWETAHVVFDAAELKLPLLGYMVENTVLQRMATRQRKRTSGKRCNVTQTRREMLRDFR
ncbi:hypothetical protein ACUOA8_60465, partial [Escherichia sp. SS-MK2]